MIKNLTSLEMLTKVDEYLQSRKMEIQDISENMPTVLGLAKHLGLTTQEMRNPPNEIYETLFRYAYTAIQEELERRIFGTNFEKVALNLDLNHGSTDLASNESVPANTTIN